MNKDEIEQNAKIALKDIMEYVGKSEYHDNATLVTYIEQAIEKSLGSGYREHLYDKFGDFKILCSCGAVAKIKLKIITDNLVSDVEIKVFCYTCKNEHSLYS